MTNVADTAPASDGRRRTRSLDPRPHRIAEIDLRLLGCSSPSWRSCSSSASLTGGQILQPMNMVTIAVQAAGVAIIATGMVLIIVSRNIDLSVGSIVGIVADGLRAADDRHPSRTSSGSTTRSVGHRARPRHRRRGGPRRRSRVSSSPTSACRRSSSRSAACWRSAASCGTSSQGAAVSGLDPVFQLLGGGPRAPSAGP